MKAFKRICFLVIVVFILSAVFLNIILIRQKKNAEGIYRVEAKRLADTFRETGEYDLSAYPHLSGVYTAEGAALYESDSYYLIIEVNGKLYRVEYQTDSGENRLLTVNIVLGILFLMTAGLLLYLYRHIIVPFGRLNKVPQELARGNLAAPIQEEKSRFFGRFTWGVNLLREKIEHDRQKEISMQREKKLLLLSLSHDIKTPLSAIKLNAKALAKGLYKDDEKRRSAAESINTRADEIESFVSQITKAASEDFMSFDVKLGEEFLSRILERIYARYAPQLSMTQTQFLIGPYDDCLLSCDPDRLAECLQNLIDNAVKYSDGKRIELRFDRMDGCELITVSNTGCTLEEKELQQIFESFHRGSNSDIAKGNGLGLFICKRLMSLMNGEVYANICNGCFEITLVVRLA